MDNFNQLQTLLESSRKEVNDKLDELYHQLALVYAEAVKLQEFGEFEINEPSLSYTTFGVNVRIEINASKFK